MKWTRPKLHEICIGMEASYSLRLHISSTMKVTSVKQVVTVFQSVTLRLVPGGILHVSSDSEASQIILLNEYWRQR